MHLASCIKRLGAWHATSSQDRCLENLEHRLDPPSGEHRFNLKQRSEFGWFEYKKRKKKKKFLYNCASGRTLSIHTCTCIYFSCQPVFIPHAGNWSWLVHSSAEGFRCWNPRLSSALLLFLSKFFKTLKNFEAFKTPSSRSRLSIRHQLIVKTCIESESLALTLNGNGTAQILKCTNQNYNFTRQSFQLGSYCE